MPTQGEAASLTNRPAKMSAKWRPTGLCLVTAVFVLAGTSGKSLADSASSVRSARYLCALIDATGLGSAPCSVSGWNSSVSLTLDVEPSDARAACRQVAAMVADAGHSFDDGWTLQIYSPYSGDTTIAYCPL